MKTQIVWGNGRCLNSLKDLIDDQMGSFFLNSDKTISHKKYNHDDMMDWEEAGESMLRIRNPRVIFSNEDNTEMILLLIQTEYLDKSVPAEQNYLND